MRRPVCFLAVACFSIGLLGVTGCNTAPDDVRSVARTFMQATEDQNSAKAQTVVTRKAQSLFTEGNASPTGDHSSSESFTLGQPVLQGENATIPVKMTDEKGTQESMLQLRREEGKWRIYAMQMPTYPGGPTVTMDFENPMAIIPDAMHAAGMVMGQVTKGMEQGAKEFAHGFEQGYGKSIPTSWPTPEGTTTPSPTAKIEEVKP